MGTSRFSRLGGAQMPSSSLFKAWQRIRLPPKGRASHSGRMRSSDPKGGGMGGAYPRSPAASRASVLSMNAWARIALASLGVHTSHIPSKMFRRRWPSRVRDWIASVAVSHRSTELPLFVRGESWPATQRLSRRMFVGVLK